MLYIIRHGKTDWNIEHRLQGRTDVPLNAEGLRMAQEAAARYRQVHFDVCYCSPLIRAFKTAQILLEGRDVPIITDDRLIEMGFGVYEGTANCFDIPNCPMKVFFKHPEDYKVPVEGGESMDELFARTGEFLKEVVEPDLAAGKDVLIVGHGAMNSCITCQVKKRDVADFWADDIENCKLHTLIED